MKKKIIPLIVLLGTIGAQAQTGIGTYLPHGTAELEVSSTDKGMLIPRLALTDEKDVNTVKGGEYPESLLVYHTGIPTLEAGFYFWANKKWNALVSNSTLYNYIKETAKDGNVTITNEGDQNFSFTWVDKNTGKKETVSLETLVKGMETVTTLSKGTDKAKATLVYNSEDKENPKTEINLTDLLGSSTDFTNFLTTFVSQATITETETTIEPILNSDNKRTGVYKYYNEKRNSTTSYEPVTITVVDDVVNNFETITNNPIFKTELNKYFTENPPAGGTVTYKFENDTHIFNYTDKDGKPVALDMSKVVKDYETDTPIKATTKKVGEDDVRTGVYTYKSEKSPEITINVVDDVANNFGDIIKNENVKNVFNDYFTTNPPAGGTVTYKFENDTHIFNYTDKDGKPVVLDMSKIVKDYETDTPIKATTKKVGEDDVRTGEYKYKSEKGTEITINVVDDVANNFDKVINNNEFKTVFNRYLTDNVEGNVTYKGGKFYYTVKKDDGTFKNEEITLEEIIKENSVLAKLDLTNDVNPNAVKGVFTFSNGKTGSQDVKYAETLTAITKGKETGTGDDTNFIAYNYKDETGENAIAQITVTSDVISSFKEIINDPNVVNQLNTFISGATGSVTVSKDNNGDVIIGYKDGDPINLTTEIGRVQKYGKVTGVDADATNKTGAGFTYNNGKDEAGSYTESVTGFTTAITEVTLEGGKKGQSVVYNYKDEATNTQALNLTDDVAKSFETIINKDGNKEIIKDIVTETAGTGAIAELKLVTDPKENVDEVKAGFTFKDGNDAANDVAFAETLTKITMEQFNMYIYMDPDPVTGDVIEVHVDTPRPGEEPAFDTYKANKFVYENEKGDKIDIKGSDLFKTTGGNSGGNNNLETLTSLRVEKSTDIDNPGKYLVYLDEKSQETYIPVKEIFDQDETITKLEVDLDKNSLIYTNETGVPNPISLNQIVNEPWYVAKTTTQATKNDQDIYTQGWVGIGYDTPSDLTKVPNEKLRVNGSITATNSYYADYVFESYFDGYSSLKYDYKFNDLNTVDNFIKTNRHLPGITPINELRKTETGYSFNISELSIQLLEKTEELFLHVIDQQKELNAKESRIEKLESEMTEMSDRLRALEALLTK